MRVLHFFVAQVCMCALSLCFAGEKTPSFRALILYEKGTLRGIHEEDAKGMKKTFKCIGDSLERPVNISYWETRKTTTNKIKKWGSKIGSKDIVVVYYSGQDVPNRPYKGLWPLTKIGKDTLPLDQLARQIHSKKAKLSLVFADCYNSFLKLSWDEKRPYGKPLERVKKKAIRNKIKQIWSSAKGTLTMCSAKHGAEAHGIILEKAKFGTFTEALLSAITYGTIGAMGKDTEACSYPKMIKLSEFTPRIFYHMRDNPISSNDIQIPFYTSPHVDG